MNGFFSYRDAGCYGCLSYFQFLSTNYVQLI